MSNFEQMLQQISVPQSAQPLPAQTQSQPAAPVAGATGLSAQQPAATSPIGQQPQPAYPGQQAPLAYPAQQTQLAYPGQQAQLAYPGQQAQPAYPGQQAPLAYPGYTAGALPFGAVPSGYGYALPGVQGYGMPGAPQAYGTQGQGMPMMSMMPMSVMLVPVMGMMPVNGGQVSGVGSIANPAAAAAGTTATKEGSQTGQTGGVLRQPFSGQAPITQPFGPTAFAAEPPYQGYDHFHTGVDFGLPSDTPIAAAGAGTVLSAGWDDTGYGNCIRIDHGNGLVTLYAHLDNIMVKPGDTVQSGQEIGLSGSTGNSTGPHLHFGVKNNGQWVDPMPYLSSAASSTAADPAPVSAGLRTLPSTGSPTSTVPIFSTSAASPEAATPASADSPIHQPDPIYEVTTFGGTPGLASGTGSKHHAQSNIAAQPPVGSPYGSLPVSVVAPIFAPIPQPAAYLMPVVPMHPLQTTPAAGTATPASNTSIFTTTASPATQITPAGTTPAVQDTFTSQAAQRSLSWRAPSSVDTLIGQVAAAQGVSRSLVAAVVQAESSGDPSSVSPSGAKGLMQLMDGTAAQLGVTDVFDPRQNLTAGVQYLQGLLTRYHGDVHLALAAYNAGPGTVDRYGGIPPYRETQQYVRNVLDLQQQYAASTTGGSN